MRKMAKDNIIVVCTIVLCIMLTLTLCISFSEGGLLGVFNKVDTEAQIVWAIACGGYSDMKIARQSAGLVKSKGGAGYVEKGDTIEIVYAVYKSEDEANAVLAKLSDKSLYVKKYEIAKGSFKWCKDEMKSAVDDALKYFDTAFDVMFECSDSLNEGSISISDAKTKIKVLYSQIEDIKSEFYQKVKNYDNEEITQIKLGLVTTLALLDNIDFSKNEAQTASSIRYQLVQTVLCRQALMNAL